MKEFETCLGNCLFKKILWTLQINGQKWAKTNRFKLLEDKENIFVISVIFPLCFESSGKYTFFCVFFVLCFSKAGKSLFVNWLVELWLISSRKRIKWNKLAWINWKKCLKVDKKRKKVKKHQNPHHHKQQSHPQGWWICHSFECLLIYFICCECNYHNALLWSHEIIYLFI